MIKKTSKVSCIITTYNRVKLLTERSLPSALNQNFKNYEIIVVDDAGTDQTAKIINNYPNVRYFKLPENKGVSYARNFGIKQSKGEYVVCLDDDNELLPNFLERTIESIGNFDAVNVGRIIQYKDFADYAEPYIGQFISVDWGWLIKKKVFDEIQYDEELKANEDTDFGIRFYKKFNYRSLNEPLTIAYDIDNPRESLSFPTERELKGMVYFYEKNFLEYKDHPKEFWHLCKLMGRKFYRGGYRWSGIQWFWFGFRSYPNLRSFIHWFVILFGWTIYDFYMTIEEKLGAKRRKQWM